MKNYIGVPNAEAIHVVIGIGVDLVLVRRIHRMLLKFGSRFTEKIFSKTEIEDSLKYKNDYARIRHFAKRFAAKEAYVKAMGIGIGKGIRMRDISVYNDKYGKPCISLLDSNPEHRAELSISDDGDYAIAFVIIYSK